VNYLLKLLLVCSLSLNGYFLWQYDNYKRSAEKLTEKNTVIKPSKVTRLPEKFQHAVALFRNNLFDEAVLEYTQLLENNPSFALQLKRAWQQQLESWLSHHDDELSEQFLTAFLNSHPYDVSMLELDAKRMINQGHVQQGIISLMALHNQLGKSKQARFAKRISELTKLKAESLIEEQNWQELLNHSQQWLDYMPQNTFYLLVQAQAYFHLGDLVASQIALEQLPANHEHKQEADELYRLIQQALAGVEVVPLIPHGSHYLVNSIINDDTDAKLMIDTGASFTVLTQSLLEQLKEPAHYLGTMQVNTANGLVEAQHYQVHSFQIGQQRLYNFDVLVLKSHGSYGLLGMNFLENFKFNINQQVNELELIKDNY